MVDLSARTMDITPLGSLSSKCGIRNRSDQLSAFYVRTRCSVENTVNGHNAGLASTDEEDYSEQPLSSPSNRARKTQRGLKVIYPKGQSQPSGSTSPRSQLEPDAEMEGHVPESEVTPDAIDFDHQTSAKDPASGKDAEEGPSEPPKKKSKKYTKKRTSLWILAENLECCYCPFTVDDRRLEIRKLNEHIRDEHLNQLYVCPALGCRDAYFYHPSSLRRHMNNAHKDKVTDHFPNRFTLSLTNRFALHSALRIQHGLPRRHDRGSDQNLQRGHQEGDRGGGGGHRAEAEAAQVPQNQDRG